MIKLEKTEVCGWEPSIRGMRNPHNSWDRMDSYYGIKNPEVSEIYPPYIVGPNDHDRMMKLSNGGPVHAKYRRMIVVYVDITAPLYWWKEFDTYRVGVTPNPADIEINSCSTMHKIHDKEFTLEDFSCEHLCPVAIDHTKRTVELLNSYRRDYINKDGASYHDKQVWWQMIQLLPSSYNQKRTLMLNYEVLANIYEYRKGHKLDEWGEFCKWIESLPYSEIITGKEEKRMREIITFTQDELVQMLEGGEVEMDMCYIGDRLASASIQGQTEIIFKMEEKDEIKRFDS